jgi:large subunit ribosomal protein L18
MIRAHKKKIELQHRRRKRVKGKFNRYSVKPRLVVNRSAKHITAQIVNDLQGHVLVSASSIEKTLAGELGDANGKVEVAKRVGLVIGRRAAEKKIKEVIFDRGSYLYHGRIQALAEGAREGGLKF